MLSVAGQIISWLKKKVETTTAHYLGLNQDLQNAELDSDVIIREINYFSKNLMFNSSLTAEEKELYISKIGHMAYMGAPEVSRTAGTCLNEMMTLLKNKRTSESLKESLLMAISEICYLNRDNQSKAVAAFPTLVDIMGSERIHMSRLACYCISCIVCNNFAAMQTLRDEPNLRKNLAGCLSVEVPWFGWSENYAILLVDILGLSEDISELKFNN